MGLRIITMRHRNESHIMQNPGINHREMFTIKHRRDSKGIKSGFSMDICVAQKRTYENHYGMKKGKRERGPAENKKK